MTILLQGAGWTTPTGGQVELSLAIQGDTTIDAGFGGTVVATLSGIRPIDTDIFISTNGVAQAEVVSPQQILAGGLNIGFSVGNQGGYSGPVTISVTSDAGVTVLNTVEFTFNA